MERPILGEVPWRRESLSWYAQLMARRYEIGAGKLMTLTVQLPDVLERRLRECATRDGRSVEEYVLGLIERDTAGPVSGRGSDSPQLLPDRAPTLSDGEFEHLLDELAAGPRLPHLPADFSRADIYADHD